MAFASPIWLIALAPWAGLAVWLLTGRRVRLAVPFLALWPKDQPPPAKRRRLSMPPAGVTAAMLAALAGILSAARPRLWAGAGEGPAITLIIDRGITMSAKVGEQRRYVALAAEAARRLAPGTRVDLRAVPDAGQRWTRAESIAGAVESLGPTALDTAEALRVAVAERLANSTGPVIVLSDRAMPAEDERVAVIAPEAIENVGIVRIAAREKPDQMMVRLRNESNRSSTRISVSGAGEPVRREVQLPPRGEQRDYFIDLPPLGDAIAVELAPGDALEADDRAYLVRQRRWPAIEVAPGIAPELGWMARVYAAQRPAGGRGRTAAVVGELDRLPRYQAGVAYVGGGGAIATSRPAALEISDHPVARLVQWSSVLRDARISPPPGDTWTPVVQAGGRPIVAIRRDPVRQAWVGFESHAFPRSADWVVFWKNVFDWLGEVEASGAGDDFHADEIAALGPEWRAITAESQVAAAPGLWPGIWKNERGESRALNATSPALGAPPRTQWERLERIADESQHGRDVAAWVAIVAVALLALAAGVWPSSFASTRRPRSSVSSAA